MDGDHYVVAQQTLTHPRLPPAASQHGRSHRPVLRRKRHRGRTQIWLVDKAPVVIESSYPANMFDWWQKLWRKSKNEQSMQDTEVLADGQTLQNINIPKHIIHHYGWQRTSGLNAAICREQWGIKPGLSVCAIMQEADALGVGAITAYAFSTENWKRPETEVNLLMHLIEQYLGSELDEFMTKNVRVRFHWRTGGAIASAGCKEYGSRGRKNGRQYGLSI